MQNLNKEMKIFDELFSNNMPTTVRGKILELQLYQNKLRDKWQVPDKNKDWDTFFKKVTLLESNPETLGVAQEFWNLDWILSELENIESSVNQIAECLVQKRQEELSNKINHINESERI